MYRDPSLSVKVAATLLMLPLAFAAGGPDGPSSLRSALQEVDNRVIVGIRPSAGQRGMRGPGIRAMTRERVEAVATDLQTVGFRSERNYRLITAVSGTVEPSRLAELMRKYL